MRALFINLGLAILVALGGGALGCGFSLLGWLLLKWLSSSGIFALDSWTFHLNCVLATVIPIVLYGIFMGVMLQKKDAWSGKTPVYFNRVRSILIPIIVIAIGTAVCYFVFKDAIIERIESFIEEDRDGAALYWASMATGVLAGFLFSIFIYYFTLLSCYGDHKCQVCGAITNIRFNKIGESTKTSYQYAYNGTEKEKIGRIGSTDIQIEYDKYKKQKVSNTTIESEGFCEFCGGTNKRYEYKKDIRDV